jgi:hypothetical protein
VKYHYGDRSFAYSVRRGTDALHGVVSGLKGASLLPRPAPRTLSGGEFGWGGTSVK